VALRRGGGVLMRKSEEGAGTLGRSVAWFIAAVLAVCCFGMAYFGWSRLLDADWHFAGSAKFSLEHLFFLPVIHRAMVILWYPFCRGGWKLWLAAPVGFVAGAGVWASALGGALSDATLWAVSLPAGEN